MHLHGLNLTVQQNIPMCCGPRSERIQWNERRGKPTIALYVGDGTICMQCKCKR